MTERPSRFKRVIAVGLDGFDPGLTDTLLNSNELPNLARLRQRGGYDRVATTTPALTPAAWSTFATGTNPGSHGIFDFVHRDPKTYTPVFALSRYEQKNAFSPPKAVNLRQGTPLWDHLSKAGIRSQIIRCPGTYPADPVYGRLLAGVGVPDLRGGLGTTTFYSSDASTRAQESENVVHVTTDSSGRSIRTHLIGPRNPKTLDSFQFELTIDVAPSRQAATIRSDGQPKLLELRKGQWSDWLHVKFKTGLLQSVAGMVRFYLIGTEPGFELYASPVNFDPTAPMFPISSPPEYAAELAAKLGTFYTTGMVEDHTGLNNGRFDEAAYLDQCNQVMREREAMFSYELDRFDEGFFYCLFDTPDRVSHMFWRTRESAHPANVAHASIPPELERAIEDQYRACDAVVGKALEHADGDTLVVVLSDHGMSSFQRCFNVNTWLHQQGLLELKAGVEPGEAAGDLFRNVDWERTRAYALGLGGVYLNLEGREGKGVVAPAEASALRAKIAECLAGTVDSERGQVAIRSAISRDNLYSGPWVDRGPDVAVNFAAGYRVSWETPLGGVPAELFTDNQKRWSGDHTVDPSLVPGVLLMNHPFAGAGAHLADLAPTILAALGVPKGSAMEGNCLLPI